MAVKIPGQVFIVGMNGSGTTMLLDHLASHSMIFGCPGETRSLPYFIRNQSRYGDLGDDRNFLKLWNEMRKSIAGRIVSRDARIPLPADWRERPRSAASVFDQIMCLFASANGKRIWCEKTPMHVHHLDLLAEAFPNARFIHIIRDGRDCAASFHRRWKFNPVRSIYRWKHAVRAGRSQGALLGPRYYEIRYEDVTRSPERSLNDICDFLGLPFEPAVLDAARQRPQTTGASGQAIAPNPRSAGRYFSATVLAKMERVAGKYLTELGYQCENPSGNLEPSRLTNRYWEITDDVRRLGVVVLGKGRLFKPGNWPYVMRRVRGALKQKATLRS